MNLTWIILFVVIFHSVRINKLQFTLPLTLFFIHNNFFSSKINEICLEVVCQLIAYMCVCVATVSTRLPVERNISRRLIDCACYRASLLDDMNKTFIFNTPSIAVYATHCIWKLFNEFTTALCATRILCDLIDDVKRTQKKKFFFSLKFTVSLFLLSTELLM